MTTNTNSRTAPTLPMSSQWMSLTNETKWLPTVWCRLPGRYSATTPKTAPIRAWPISLARMFRPRLFFLLTLR